MNKFLEKIAVTRLVKEIALGNVKTRVSDLNRMGFLRSPNQYAAGMRKGTSNLLRQSGGVINQGVPGSLAGDLLHSSGGYMTTVKKDGVPVISFDKTIGSPLLNQKDFGSSDRRTFSKNLMHQALLRHEAFEAQAVSKAIKNGKLVHSPEREMQINESITSNAKSQGAPDSSVRRYLRGVSNIISPDSPPTPHGHYQFSILGQESELVRKTPYLRNSPLHGMRAATGETTNVRRATGKSYGWDKLTGKDFAKMNRYSYPEPDLE